MLKDFDMITKNFIITEKGRKNGMNSDFHAREIDRIVCASQYDYYGQSSLYCNAYFKMACLVGISISADKVSEIDKYTESYIKYGYLIEDRR